MAFSQNFAIYILMSHFPKKKKNDVQLPDQMIIFEGLISAITNTSNSSGNVNIYKGNPILALQYILRIFFL